ncbi:unnamed protein product [Cylindrotheca closterium]|uniref:protein-tyrosine-phosphatase n=1 Tax=Cylindrotheca closterium TaxID=2856 RepID=A0AAD2CU95_9STRA|nr:unnamed protein product [Cylindrotheca closterium]
MSCKVTLPPLPPLHSNMASLKDTHSFSEDAHWVIPGHLMQGKHPIRESFENMPWRVHDLVHRARCTTFVCLQAECPPQRASHRWSFLKSEKNNGTHVFGGLRDWKRNPFLLEPYRPLVESSIKSRKEQEHKSEIRVSSFVHFGMEDLSPAEDLKELVDFVKYLAIRILNGEVIYLHCWGGKGRSGLVAACLLGVLYKGITAKEALQRIGSYCQLRNAGYHIHSPETSEQLEQVRDFFALL